MCAEVIASARDHCAQHLAQPADVVTARHVCVRRCLQVVTNAMQQRVVRDIQKFVASTTVASC